MTITFLREAEPDYSDPQQGRRRLWISYKGVDTKLIFHYEDYGPGNRTLWVGDDDGFRIYKPFRETGSMETFKALKWQGLIRIYNETMLLCQ
jgi:hypothetical protein